MMKIVKSVALIVASLAIVAAGTYAWSQQTETVSGTTFSAGSMDLKIDDNISSATQHWVDSFVSPVKVENMKPGYSSSQIVDIMSEGDANAIASVKLALTENKENTVLTPETEAGDDNTINDWSGELAQNIRIKISFDAENDLSFIEKYDFTLAEFHNNPDLLELGAITSGTGIASVKFDWSIPADASNKIMTDSVKTDVVFGLK